MCTRIRKMYKKIEGVQEASISFMAEKMIIEYDETNKEEIMKKIQKVIKKEEPDVTIKEI